MPPPGERLFLFNYNDLANEADRTAGAAGRSKYVFSMHLLPRRQERIWFFKSVSGPHTAQFFYRNPAKGFVLALGFVVYFSLSKEFEGETSSITTASTAIFHFSHAGRA
jgi:hypothetical protein